MSRTRKEPKTGAKAVAHTCRNNGTCDYCKGNRLHKHKRKELVMSDEDYTGEAIAMDGIEEEHQGDADVARYERSNRKVNPD